MILRCGMNSWYGRSRYVEESDKLLEVHCRCLMRNSMASTTFHEKHRKAPFYPAAVALASRQEGNFGQALAVPAGALTTCRAGELSMSHMPIIMLES
jgi:hypothetical protein